MESIRVDISYRPLRIGWGIRAGDIDAFRSAVSYSYALWGGRFNPILIVDYEEPTRRLADLFRLDLVFPIGNSEAVQGFPKQFPYLIKPFYDDHIFTSYGPESRSYVLDVHNALISVRGTPEWEAARKKGFRIYSWAPDDPLRDVFLMQCGGYPDPKEIQIDYRRLFKEAANAAEVKIEAGTKLPWDLLDYGSVPFVSRCGLERQRTPPSWWDYPGFYWGDAENVDDLVQCWNIRAADVPLLFVDRKHVDRYSDLIPHWEKAMRERVSRRSHEFERSVGIWAQQQRIEEPDPRAASEEVLKPFGKDRFSLCRVDKGSLGVRPPMMELGEVSVLGVVGRDEGRIKISFSLDKKPYSDDFWFHSQHLVASLSFIGGLYGDEQHMLVPPFIPELNEFYARAQHFQYNKIRSEYESIGLAVEATDSSSFIYALPVADLFERVFDLSGYSSRLSEAGLIARQLIAQLGGADGARAFKIPGVRRLIKTHGPAAAFTKKSALELIGSRDPENPTASFGDYANLYIEPRQYGTELTPDSVFTYLVEKGLFRIGAELSCSHCRLPSWTGLELLKQHVICELCGKGFDATRQLVNDAWRYRRSGVLGVEKNAQGTVPVVLTLQQLKVSLSSFRDHGVYSPSLELKLKTGKGESLEIDFAWLIPHGYPDRTRVIIGECKDRGGKKSGKDVDTIDANDIENLRKVADALPERRFKPFIVLAKLAPFTPNEIALAKTLNGEYERRAILLTDRELEPYRIYERTQIEFKDIRSHASTPEDLANVTHQIYFQEKAKPSTALGPA